MEILLNGKGVEQSVMTPVSPLKKKDLMNEFGNAIGGGTLKDQECETDEEESSSDQQQP